jgi:hypothetical protein
MGTTTHRDGRPRAPRKAAGIDLALAAITAAHKAAGHDSPRDSAGLRAVRRGIRRRLSTAQREAAPHPRAAPRARRAAGQRSTAPAIGPRSCSGGRACLSLLSRHRGRGPRRHDPPRQDRPGGPRAQRGEPNRRRDIDNADGGDSADFSISAPSHGGFI